MNHISRNWPLFKEPLNGSEPSGDQAREVPVEETNPRRKEVNDLLVETFNSILRVEEEALQSRMTEGLTISEVHTIHAIGLYDASPMSVIASRLDVTLASCTASVGKLVEKGYAERKRSEEDRRQVLVTLTKAGRQAYRAHELFHRQMVDAALGTLTLEEEEVFAGALIKVKEFFDNHSRS